MNKLTKSLLVLIALCVIGFFSYIIFRSGPTVIITPIPKAPNSFVKDINTSIIGLGKLSENRFCKSSYDLIKNDITAYASFKKIDTAWEELLLKNLDYTYTPLFIRQAFYVFDSSVWESRQRSIIWSEANRLIDSSYVTNHTDLNRVKAILIKFWEIARFNKKAISFANDVNFNSLDQKFDESQTNLYITKASHYYNLHTYANNNTWLQSQLQNTPNIMYNKHLEYLSNRVSFCLSKYNTLTNMDNYYDTIYRPTFEEFQLFEDAYSIYSVSITELSGDLDPLKSQMQLDGKEAEKYYQSLRDSL